MEEIDRLREDIIVNFTALIGLLARKEALTIEEWKEEFQQVSAKAQAERVCKKER